MLPICGALGAAVSAGLPPSKAVAQKKSSSSRPHLKNNDLSDRSERQQKLLSIVVTTGTIYELGAVVCEWALRGVYEPWW
jgi:hypothetical protein